LREICLAQGHPDAPGEWGVTVVDADFDKAPDEEMLIGDYALVG
jgi:hypothetical protein